MVDIASGILNFANSGILILVLIIGVTFAAFGMIIYRRQLKFKYKCIELVPQGNGKVWFNISKCGWFKTRKIFFKLIDIGKQERMEVKDGRKIIDFSTEDYHYFGRKGQRCVVVTSSPSDPSVLVPVSKVELDKALGSMFLEAPNIDIRDAAVDAFKLTEKEMKGMGEMIVQVVVLGLIVLGAFLTIIFTTQFAERALSQAAELTVDNANLCADAVSSAVERIVSRGSNAA